MPSIIEDVGKYVIGVFIGAAALVFVNWFDAPGMDEIKAMVDKESPWIRERLLIISRLDSMERTDSSLSLRIDAILSKLDSIQTLSSNEMRGIQNSMFRIMAKLELLDEAKKKEGEPLQ